MRTSSKVEIFGYVGKDPSSPSSTHPNFVTFPVSVTTKRKDKTTNEETQFTTWYECQTSNGALSTLIKKYIKKGTPLYLEGTPKCDGYLDKEGKPSASFKVNINEFRILEFPKNNEVTGVEVTKVVFDNDEIPW